MVNRYGYTFQEAKNTLSILPIISIVLGPIVSTVTTKLGQKPLFLCFVSAMLTGIYFLMTSFIAQPTNNLFYCLIGLGCYFSVFGAIIWPMMTLSVPPIATAIALGIATTF